MSTDQDTTVVVDVDLDAPVPCRSQECPRPAAWLCQIVHCPTHNVCTSAAFCKRCRRRLAREERQARRQGALIACATHRTPVHTVWSPL